MVLATNRGRGAEAAGAVRDGQCGWSLPADEVHVWRESLERPPEAVTRLRRLLAVDERTRADRFRFVRDRSRYTVGRALLRILLGRYTGQRPEDVRFEYGSYDKPHLAEPGPWFNLAHSGSTVLYCFTRAAEVGIDIERDDADFARERIAERFFSPTEVAVLRSLPESLQPRAFLRCWTRKEAFIKARGDGLSLALDSFDVTLAPNTPAALLRTAWSPEEPGRWRLHDLSDPAHGYIAALALRSSGWKVEGPILDNIEGFMPEQEEI